MSEELQKAIKYYADTYVSMIVGTSIEDGLSAAKQVAHNFKYRYSGTELGVYPDNIVADFVYAEANAMDM